jgi:hypothetical protein
MNKRTMIFLTINYYQTSAASERIKTKLVQEMMEWFTTLP